MMSTLFVLAQILHGGTVTVAEDSLDLQQQSFRRRRHSPPSSKTCSPEICNIKGGGQRVTLETRTYLIDRQVLLPKGTILIGAGIGKTLIQAVGEPLDRSSRCRGVNSCRRGFMLNDHTYVGSLTFIGRDKGRWGDNELLYGGAPFETPGCTDSYCNTTGLLRRSANFCTANGCNGIEHATVEDVEVRAFSTQTVVFVAETPKNRPKSGNLRFNRLYADGTWADGVNIHGSHSNIVVSNSVIRYTSDDGFAIWSDEDKETNVSFINNTMEYPRWDRNWLDRGDGEPRQLDCSTTGQQGGWGVNCFAMYGGGSGNKFVGNRCVSTYWAFLALHGRDKFRGWFNPSVEVTVKGNSVSSGSGAGPNCCNDCPFCWWVNEKTSHWSKDMQPRIVGGDCANAGSNTPHSAVPPESHMPYIV